MQTIKLIPFVLLFCSVAFANAQSVASEKFYTKLYDQAMKAFEKGDAETLASLFTEDAEEINPMGMLAHGRAAIQEGYSNLFKMFAQFPKPDKSITEVLDLHHNWVSPDVYLTNYIDKTTRTYGSKTEIEQLATSVLLVKQKDKWYIKNLSLVPVKSLSEIVRK